MVTSRDATSKQATSKGGSRKSVQQRGTTAKKAGVLRVMLDGEDVTPEPLNPVWANVARLAQGLELTSGSRIGAQHTESSMRLQSQSVSMFHTQLQKQNLEAESVFKQSAISVDNAEDIVIEGDRNKSPEKDESEEMSGPPPDIDAKPPPQHVPKYLSLVLRETPTDFLFELPSKTVEKNTDEAVPVEADNELYEYLTEGKGRNRKMVNVEVQTATILYKTRATMAERVKKMHCDSFASIWEMYDSFKAAAREVTIEDVGPKAIIDKFLAMKALKELEECELTKEIFEMNRLIKNETFLEAVCIMERLLASNNFNKQQKRYRGLSDPDPFRENIEYNYRLNLLWTYANKETSGRCVTAICWNDSNTDILAVAYGKFYYTERTTGIVMVWNVKNPVQPERTYRFDTPVTAISFSKQNPNLLLIGFYNGTIKLLDVSSRDLTMRVIGYSGRDCPSVLPIWQVVWYRLYSSHIKETEQIISICQDGRIGSYKCQESPDLIYSQIMRIGHPEGKLKGLELFKQCRVPGIPISRYTAALVLQQHPADSSIYFVGTSQGTIHRCSTSYFYQHVDLFRAHDGPVYIMKFSPFCNKLFLTCGDDWNVRIWADGIMEPLFELTKVMQSVQEADWSPSHSTIIANICGPEIYIWDLQRKTYSPQSVTLSPNNCRNTVISFSKSGRCLIVGDIEGSVHVYALEDMPFPSFFQDDLLINSIFRGLITRPDLIKRLKKLGGFNF